MSTCFIWSKPAEVQPWDYGGGYVRSSRVAGSYRITGTGSSTIKHIDDETRAKLTTWILNRNREGEEWPIINSQLISDAEGWRRLRIGERKERFWIGLAKRGFHPGDRVAILSGAVQEVRPHLDYFGAWMESESDKETAALIHLLTAEGYLAHSNERFTLASKGYEALDNAESRKGQTNQAFVAMWFDVSMSSIYDEAISPAVRESGYQPFRVDRKEHNNKIDDEIVAEIRRSAFLIADFTCGTYESDGAVKADMRGGVYYEAGLAQGIGIPVIWSVQASLISYVHFDTRQFAHIVWEDAADLKTKLLNRIRATIVR